MVGSIPSDKLATGLIGQRTLYVRAPGVMGRAADPWADVPGREGRGPVGEHGAHGRLFADSGEASGKAATKRTMLKMKVRIIEFPVQKVFTDAMRKSITASVEGELKRLSGKLKKSKARFNVSWDRPKSLPKDKPVPKVLLVYVIDNSRKVLDQSMALLYKAFKSSAIDATKIGESLRNEGGVNVKELGGLVSLSFCSVVRIAKHTAHSGLDKIFADIVLHEIGHGMDADHPDGGVMSGRTVYSSTVDKTQSYSGDGVRNIDNFLARL